MLILGLQFGVGPCVASCGPILASYIAGTKKGIFEGFRVYLVFSLARISVYLALSSVIFWLGSFALERFFGEYARYIIILGGIFIIIVGIFVALGKKFKSGICRFMQRNILENDPKSVIILGLIAGITPCAPLIAALSFVGFISKTWSQSLLYGLSFGIGTFISPLIFLSMFAGFISKIIKDKDILYARVFNLACAGMIVFLGIKLLRKAF